MRTLRDPDAEAALRFLQAECAVGRRHVVQAVADCVVRYQGRARSDLTRGERLVILKPDGALLVHGPEGAKPINWQPPGAMVAVATEEGQVVLTSHRLKPPEVVRVTFHAISLLAAIPLRDGADLSLLGSEDDLQQLLFAHPGLVEPGFVPARRERDSARGFYDLDGHDAQGRRLIVEAKRIPAGTNEAQQLWRYVERERRANPSIRGLLVAPGLSPKAKAILEENRLEFRAIDWGDILPKVEAMRKSGQASLGRFG